MKPTTSTLDISPPDFGITNPKFTTFSKQQLEGLSTYMDLPDPDSIPVGERQALILCLPTGSGKTLLNFTISKLAEMQGRRALILTHSKGLQDQAERDHSCDGLKVIKGRSNYTCDQHGDCERGSLFGCNAGSECPAEQAKAEAAASSIVMANYAYWITVNRHVHMSKPIGEFDVIIMDEAHLAPQILSDHLTVTLTPDKFTRKYQSSIGKQLASTFPELHESPKPRAHLDPDELAINVGLLSTWAKNNQGSVNIHLADLKERFNQSRAPHLADEIKLYGDLQEDLNLLASMKPANWVVDKPRKDEKPDTETDSQPDRITSTPIWVGQYNRYLLSNARHVIMTSATIRPKTGTLLGLKAESTKFREWGRIFPASHNPVFYIPTATLTWKTESLDSTRKLVVDRILEIINHHKGHRGIIGTVSYHRMNWLYNALLRAGDHDVRSRLIRHETMNKWRESGQQLVDRYLKHEAAVALSPILSTGWDFPDDKCRFVIIPKIPFVVTKDLVMRARKEADKTYASYLTVLDLVQICGRGSRHMKDWCTCYIIDDSWKWFQGDCQHLAPKSFQVDYGGPLYGKTWRLPVSAGLR